MDDGAVASPSESTWHGQDALRSALKELGFRLGLVLGAHNTCNWWAFRTPSLPVGVVSSAVTRFHQISVHPYADVVEVDLSGEIHGTRYRLLACGLSPEGLEDRLPAIEARLIDAWEALAVSFRNT